MRTSQKLIGVCLGMILLVMSLSSCLTNVNNLQMREYTDEEFADPDVIYRPMPIEHGGVDKARVFHLKELGYGGIVTNVSYAAYLENEEMWEDFEDLVEYTIENIGLRLWIYDERGYPSGAAGDIVLRDNMDWQSKGIVCLSKTSDQKELLTLCKPYGHIRTVTAFAFKGTDFDQIDYSSYIDLSSNTDSEGTLSWEAPESGWTAVCIYTKNFYEKTHAAFNWSEVRRYIDLLRPEPVQKFIDVTYKQYYDRVGKYFGNGIEAFFTDEPSLMGTYFVDGPPTTPKVIHPVDNEIPLLLTANFGDTILSEFLERREYDATQFLPYLFFGNSEQAQRFRWDYFKTTSELVAENYTGQIGEFCEDHNIAMSGHLLLEEDIYMHPIFEGNYLQIMQNMQYPGIDLLTSHPEKALSWASTTAKFASSAAGFTGRKKVMSEVSDAFDSNKGDVEGRIGAVAVQYALGVNHINSYYQVNDMTEEENRMFTDTIGRFSYMMDGGTHISRVALYYPIEGVWTQSTAPQDLYSFSSGAKEISLNFKELTLELLQNQIDFDYFDSINLSKCKVKDNKIVTPLGKKYSVLVIPYTTALESSTIDFLIDAADNGVRILLQDMQDVIVENGKDTEVYQQKMKQLSDETDTDIFSSVFDVPDILESQGIRDLKLAKKNRNIIYRKIQFKDKSVYMLVNVSTKDQIVDLTFNDNGPAIKIWDPFQGTVQQLEDNDTTVKYLKISRLKIESGKALFVSIE